MDFMERIRVWEETSEMAKERFPITPEVSSRKYKYDKNYPLDTSLYDQTNVMVRNEDTLVAARRLALKGKRPLALVMADHRFAGGDVQRGSGAQEESLFRRTNLCLALPQDLRLYPIAKDEAILVKSATVFRDTEKNMCKPLERPYEMDFVVCPGLHNPRTLDDGSLDYMEEITLRKKLRLIFQVAQKGQPPYDSLVLGAMGCGAWKSPPESVAAVMKEELDAAGGAFERIVVACLEVDAKDYIVVDKNDDQKASNYEVFSRAFRGH
jgi:uncharacterized protein (TIGR02452 family)